MTEAREMEHEVGPPQTVSMRTRDGVRLDADVYRPIGRGPFPVLLMRQPYGRRIASTVVYAHPHWYASHGYVVVIQDVRVLASALTERAALERPGDLAVLRRYARARREDVTAMQFVTDRLDRLFASGKPGAYSLRNWGLRLVDSQEWAKDALRGRWCSSVPSRSAVLGTVFLERPIRLANLLEVGLSKKPDEPALISLERTWTWRELDQSSTRLAGQYLALGLKPGDRVASLLPNRGALLVHSPMALSCQRRVNRDSRRKVSPPRRGCRLGRRTGPV